MFAMLLFPLDGSPDDTPRSRAAKDVPTIAWFADAMYWAQNAIVWTAKHQLIEGKGNGAISTRSEKPPAQMYLKNNADSSDLKDCIFY